MATNRTPRTNELTDGELTNENPNLERGTWNLERQR
jgi:hypothetical protein